MDYAEKKDKLANLIEEAANDESKKPELLEFVEECLKDENFKGKPLYESILNEIKDSSEELSRKGLKQRASMIRTFLE